MVQAVRGSAILLAWWFLAYGHVGGPDWAARSVATVGPFSNQQDCLDAAAAWKAVDKWNRVLTIGDKTCWYGETGR